MRQPRPQRRRSARDLAHRRPARAPARPRAPAAPQPAQRRPIAPWRGRGRGHGRGRGRGRRSVACIRSVLRGRTARRERGHGRGPQARFRTRRTYHSVGCGVAGVKRDSLRERWYSRSAALRWCSPPCFLGSSGWGALAATPLPYSAHAPAGEGSKLAILPLQVEGGLGSSDQAELMKALVAGLEARQLQRRRPRPGARGRRPGRQLRQRRTAPSIAAATGAAYVVRAAVTVRDRDYGEGETGRRRRQAHGPDRGRLRDLRRRRCRGLLDSAAATLRLKLDALSKGPSALKLTSDPNGAIVTIDGEITGTTPLRTTGHPRQAPHPCQPDGLISIEREVTFVEGVNEDLNFSLEKLPEPPPGPPLGLRLARLRHRRARRRHRLRHPRRPALQARRQVQRHLYRHRRRRLQQHPR